MNKELRKEYGCVPISTGVLKAHMRQRAPQAHISLLRQKGELVSLRRNLYLCTPEEYSQAIIANHLLAPSYVSYESVLASRGIIPERVYSIRSSTLKRGRVYENATGRYEYIHVPAAYYPEGVSLGQTPQGLHYMEAKEEKAICDLILATPGLRLQSAKAAREYLEVYLRADMSAVAAWDADLIQKLAELTDKKKKDLYHLEQMLRHERF